MSWPSSATGHLTRRQFIFIDLTATLNCHFVFGIIPLSKKISQVKYTRICHTDARSLDSGYSDLNTSVLISPNPKRVLGCSWSGAEPGVHAEANVPLYIYCLSVTINTIQHHELKDIETSRTGGSPVLQNLDLLEQSRVSLNLPGGHCISF